jgi:hypothetical protein
LVDSKAGYAEQAGELRPKPGAAVSTDWGDPDLEDARAELRAVCAAAASAEDMLDGAVRRALNAESALRSGDVEALRRHTSGVVATVEAAEAALESGFRRIDDAAFLAGARLPAAELGGARQALGSLTTTLDAVVETIVGLLGSPAASTAQPVVDQRAEAVRAAVVRAECFAGTASELVSFAQSGGGQQDPEAAAWAILGRGYALTDPALDAYLTEALARRGVPQEVVLRLAVLSGQRGAAASESAADADYQVALTMARARQPQLLQTLLSWSQPGNAPQQVAHAFIDLFLRHSDATVPPVTLPELRTSPLAQAFSAYTRLHRFLATGDGPPLGVHAADAPAVWQTVQIGLQSALESADPEVRERLRHAVDERALRVQGRLDLRLKR